MANHSGSKDTSISKQLKLIDSGVLSAYRIPFDAGYSRFKLFYSEDAPIGVKRPKYIQKAGQANRLYIPPSLPEHELQSLSTLYFTEGEKKALKAVQEGLPCIGITGLWNWKRKGTDDLIPDFGNINLAGREIIIIPDSDWLDLGKKGRLSRSPIYPQMEPARWGLMITYCSIQPMNLHN
jgi:hypothetical protein